MSHLSYEQRYTIEVLLKDGQPQKEIARVLSLNKSVICREIKRNCDGRSLVYKAKLAQSKYESRQHLSRQETHDSTFIRFYIAIETLSQNDYI